MEDTIGERIKLVRKNAKQTQVQLGELLGITGAGVGKIETNVSRPTDAAIKLICKTFHVNYVWLTEGEGPMMEEMDTDALVDKYMAGESEFARSIMKSFAKLPDEEWYRLRDLIERIKKEGHP